MVNLHTSDPLHAPCCQRSQVTLSDLEPFTLHSPQLPLPFSPLPLEVLVFWHQTFPLSHWNFFYLFVYHICYRQLPLAKWNSKMCYKWLNGCVPFQSSPFFQRSFFCLSSAHICWQQLLSAVNEAKHVHYCIMIWHLLAITPVATWQIMITEYQVGVIWSVRDVLAILTGALEYFPDSLSNLQSWVMHFNST